jgi:hypothetical protein
MPYRETGNFAYKQLCLLWNSAIRRMTKQTRSVKMDEMKRLIPLRAGWHGQKHFYFQSRKLIVWFAVDPERAEEALNQILKFYP